MLRRLAVSFGQFIVTPIPVPSTIANKIPQFFQPCDLSQRTTGKKCPVAECRNQARISTVGPFCQDVHYVCQNPGREFSAGAFRRRNLQRFRAKSLPTRRRNPAGQGRSTTSSVKAERGRPRTRPETSRRVRDARFQGPRHLHRQGEVPPDPIAQLLPG